MADFETVSTSSLQIRVKIPRSPSPSVCSQQQRTSVLRSSSMRHSRSDQPPRAVHHTATTPNTLSVRPSYKTSRSLSPRPPRLETTSPTTRPPPPSPSSGLLPTRAPTPPSKFCESKGLRVPGASRGTLTPRSLSPRFAIYKKI